jgi:hypothetical protein
MRIISGAIGTLLRWKEVLAVGRMDKPPYFIENSCRKTARGSLLDRKRPSMATQSWRAD